MRKLIAEGILFFIAALAFAQNATPFDMAIRYTLAYLTARIPPNSTVVVLNIQSDYPNLSAYFVDEITSSLVSMNVFTIVDRGRLELLQQEMNFQLSGEVDDETAQAIGKEVGAQTIISGAVYITDSFYRMRIQTSVVGTARIYSRIENIAPNSFLSSLTGIPYTPPPDRTEPPKQASAEGAATPEKKPTAPAKTKPPSPTPLQAAPSNAKIFYMGLRGGLSYHFYKTPEASSKGSLSSDFAVQMSVQPLTWFALQAEAVFSGDSLKTSSDPPLAMSSTAIMYPILGKFTFRPGSLFMAAFGGVYFTTPLTAMTYKVADDVYHYQYTPSMGFIVGGNVGLKLGPGTLFADVRYASDFNDTKLIGNWGTWPLYKRSMILSSLGYEIGIFNRKRR
jgi:hypothetical protein